jgi:hypothetical protein
MSGEKIILDYAKPPSRWGRWICRAIALAIIISLILVAWFQRHAIANNFSHWSAQRQCLAFDRPAADVVFESDPVKARTLLASKPSDYQGFVLPAGDLALAAPSCWKEFLATSGTNETPNFSSATVFLHERLGRGRGGQRRLVRVVFRFGWSTTHGSVEISGVCSVEVRQPSTLFKRTPSVIQKRGIFSWPLGSPTRVFAGQVDPADPSHFTIDYEAFGQRDTIDGWLEADDSITFKPRHPPVPPSTTATAP